MTIYQLREQEPSTHATQNGKLDRAALWRHETVARADEIDQRRRLLLRRQCLRMRGWPDRSEIVDAWSLDSTIRVHLNRARQAAEQPTKLRLWGSGSAIYDAMTNLDAACIALLKLAETEDLKDDIEIVLDECAEALPSDHPRLEQLRKLVSQKKCLLTKADRADVIAVVHAAKKASLHARLHLQHFRNLVLLGALLAALLGIVVAVAGWMAPELVPLCSDPGPDGRVCPTGGSTSRGDALLVQFAGILGAAVATIFSIRKLRGSHDPYSLSVALALLKLPLGALTALLGLVLIHADLVPGLTVVGSATQILAWAIVFGYCQEIFTIFLDRHAIAVMQVSHVSKHQGTHTNPHH